MLHKTLQTALNGASKKKGIRTKDMLSDLNMGINAISEFAKGKQMSCIAPLLASPTI